MWYNVRRKPRVGPYTTKHYKGNTTMPNQPSAKNVQRGLRVQRPLDAKVIKKFRTDENMTIKDAYILALMYATRNIELTSDEYQRIAEETKKAERRTGSRRAL